MCTTKIRKNFTYLLIILTLACFLDLNFNSVANLSFTDENTYFPLDEWRISTLEEQDMSVSRIAKMSQAIVTQNMGIDSIHIIRNGHLVYERYFEYYNHSNLHQMWSTTKSITSILIGIANASGYIPNLDEPVLDIFTERTFLNVDARKQALTIRHLLKMQSGLQWNEQNVPFLTGSINTDDFHLTTNISDCNFDNWFFNPNLNPRQMMLSQDWVQFTLDKPMVTDPGTEYYYHSGASHLLSAIIQKKTGMNTETFAKQHLFNPLNITNYIWFNDSMNISMGGFGLWLQPLDMARIGYLFLNNGNWNGTQIVPSKWVIESTLDYSPGTGYGFQWWISTQGNFYYSSGFGGQHIFVKSTENLVVAVTATEYDGDNFPYLMFTSYILTALQKDPSTSLTPTTTTATTTTTTKATHFSGFALLVSLVIIIGSTKKK